MSKKQKAKKRNYRGKEFGLASAQVSNAPPLPSHEAMGLAESVLNHATRKKKKGEVTQIVVAELLDAAIRVRRAAAEQGGIQKGAEEQRQKYEREIVEGVMRRVDATENALRRVHTISLALHEAEAVVRALYGAGYVGSRRLPEQAPKVWAVRSTEDGKLEARHEQV